MNNVLEISGSELFKRATPLTKEELLTEEYYRIYNQGNRVQWAKQAAISIGFKNNMQWLVEDAMRLEENNQPALCINEVTPALKNVVSKLTENQPRFIAYARKNASSKNAAIVSDMMEYIWYISNGNVELKYAIEDSKTVGVGALMAYFDQSEDWGKGEIKVMGIDPRFLYIDPNSKKPDASDASTIMYRRLYSGREIAIQYPDFDLTQAMFEGYDDIVTSDRYAGENQIMDTTDWYDIMRYAVVDRYTKILQNMTYVTDGASFEKILDKDEFEEFLSKPAFIIHRDGQEEKYALEEAEVDYEMNVYRATGGIFHFEQDQQSGQAMLVKGFSNNRTQVTLTLVNMKNLIDLGVLDTKKRKIKRIQRVLTIGQKEHYNDILPIENHPIVTLMRYHNRNPYPTGDMPLVQPLQEELNKIHSIIISYMQNIAGVKVFVPEGTDMEDLAERLGMSGTQAFKYDPSIGAPYFVQTQQMPNAFMEQENNLVGRIQRILGSYAMQDGEVQSAPRTADGTQMLLEAGSTRMMSERFDIEASVNQLARVVLEMMPHYYKEQKIVRIRKADHKIKEFVINEQRTSDDIGASEIVNDLTVGRYDIEMLSGSMLPTNRAARAKAFTELFQLGILRDNSVILRQYEIEDVEEIIAKQDDVANLSNQVQQQQAEIKKLNGQLQTKVRENINLRERVMAEKTGAKLHKIASDTAAQAMIMKNSNKRQMMPMDSNQTGQTPLGNI